MTLQELNRLNGTAQIRASRAVNNKQYSLPDAHSLLKNPLPIMAQPLAYVKRVELFYYLRLLETDKENVSKAAQSEWRDNKLSQISDKEEEINRRLRWVDIVEVGNEDTSMPQRPGINGRRDKDAAAWVKENTPNLQALTTPQIINALRARDVNRDEKLWSSEFTDWNRNQQVWPKRRVGRKPKTCK